MSTKMYQTYSPVAQAAIHVISSNIRATIRSGGELNAALAAAGKMAALTGLPLTDCGHLVLALIPKHLDEVNAIATLAESYFHAERAA